jgi:hypothetical protein
MEDPPKAVEAPSKPPADTQQASIALAMRQLGQEAAQKAKDGMKKSKKVTETFSGAGKAEPVPKTLDKPATVPPPIAIDSSTEKYTIETPTLLQSPTTSAWKNEVHGKPTTPQHAIDKIESLQSPNSTSWKSIAEQTGSTGPVTPTKNAEVHEASSEEDDEDEAEDEAEDEEEEEEEGEEDDEDDEDEDEEEEEDEDEDDESDDQ